jgi:hypothetical protein
MHSLTFPQEHAVVATPASIKSLKAFSKTSSLSLDPDEFFKGLEKESDRGVIVVATTLLEDALTASLRKALKNFDEKEFDEFVSFNGVAGTFSGRIKLAFGLGLITGEMRTSLDVAREMRNACAHARQAIGFDTPEIQSVLPRLFPGPGSQPPQDWPPAQARSIFISMCSITSKVIDGTIPTDGSPVSPDAVNPGSFLNASSQAFLRSMQLWPE